MENSWSNAHGSGNGVGSCAQMEEMTLVSSMEGSSMATSGRRVYQ